jgi:hypothetical protein
MPANVSGSFEGDGYAHRVSHWQEWHRAYDDTDSPLARRLAIVQRCIADALDATPPGRVRVISMCAGEGRDLLGVLARHPRANDVSGRLVELDPELAARARSAAPEPVEVRCADAATTSAYEGAVPADLVLVCGVFGNVSADDIARTIRMLPSLCAPGATVIWTRHRRSPDRTVLARETFAAAGFEMVSFDAPDGFLFGVGVNRLVSEPLPFERGVTMFAFVGYDTLADTCARCGFVYDLARAEIVCRTRADAASFVERIAELDASAVRRRPARDVWSPLEYACHVRDILRIQRERLELIQRETNPSLTPMGRDERVIEERYNEQEPDVVTHEVVDAARSLAERLEALDAAGWERTATYNYPTAKLRSVEWIGAHTVHELQHHRLDITP